MFYNINLLFLYFILIINKENYNNNENACASPVFIPSQDPSCKLYINFYIFS